jgi:choline-sulfatase
VRRAVSRYCAVLAALLVAASVATGCRRAERPNVLIVTVDTLRADHVGCYGFGLAQTPAIDALAREGVSCTDAASSAPITLPAHCSIMTGLYPPAHGVRDNGNYALGPEAVTLAERLTAAGYRTGAFVSAAVLARRYGLDQGFATYDDDLWSEDEPELFMIRDRPAERTADRTLAWLEDWRAHGQGQPFFLWMHLFDPHQPYEVRALDLAALAPTPYDAEIAQADRGVGRVVDWLRQAGVLDDTLVVFTADHGESLGEHGEPTHGIFIYDATIHVPLVWRLPRVLPAGTAYRAPVRHIDIVPTVLAIVGVPAGGPMQGVDLLSAFQGRTAPPDLAQYAEARLAEQGFGMAPLAGLRHGGWKWIRAPHPELYDLRADRGERTNLYPANTDDARPLEAELDAVLAASERLALPAPTRQIDAETEEMLRALGYLAPPEQRAEMADMDPKDGMAIYASIQDARNEAQSGQWDRVQALLAPVIAMAPENVTARNILALAAVRRGDLDEAERQYRASLGYQPRQHRVYGALGGIAMQAARSMRPSGCCTRRWSWRRRTSRR